MFNIDGIGILAETISNAYGTTHTKAFIMAAAARMEWSTCLQEMYRVPFSSALGFKFNNFHIMGCGKLDQQKLTEANDNLEDAIVKAVGALNELDDGDGGGDGNDDFDIIKATLFRIQYNELLQINDFNEREVRRSQYTTAMQNVWKMLSTIEATLVVRVSEAWRRYVLVNFLKNFCPETSDHLSLQTTRRSKKVLYLMRRECSTFIPPNTIIPAVKVSTSTDTINKTSTSSTSSTASSTSSSTFRSSKKRKTEAKEVKIVKEVEYELLLTDPLCLRLGQLQEQIPLLEKKIETLIGQIKQDNINQKKEKLENKEN